MVVKRCVIVSASPDSDSEFIKSHIADDDFVICADGGADKIIPTGIIPDLIIGDFDSSGKSDYFRDTEVITLPVMKDDTDTQHCAEAAMDRGFKNILFLGATGGRLDHTLANLSVLLYLKNRGAKGRIVDKYSDISLLENGDNKLFGAKGKTVSVMPFVSKEVTLSYEGMLYPLKNQTVSAEYPFTISNIAEADEVTVTLHKGEALLIISND